MNLHDALPSENHLAENLNAVFLPKEICMPLYGQE
jgi:hypothetical protein